MDAVQRWTGRIEKGEDDPKKYFEATEIIAYTGQYPIPNLPVSNRPILIIRSVSKAGQFL